MNDLILARWNHRADTAVWAHVIPDGCCDLIVRRRPGQAPQVMVTGVDAHARLARLEAGECIRGLRFRPGTRIIRPLLAQANESALVELDLDRLDIVAPPTERLAEALDLVGRIGVPLSSVPRELGVGSRTLQRMVGEQTGRSPIFWRRLARIRIAARALREGEPAADAAARLGFSDQAHLTRECRTWLGVTPTMLRTGDAPARLLDEPGYC